MRADYLIDLENIILGMMLQGNKPTAIATSQLVEDDFTEARKTVFNAIKDEHMQGKTIDNLLLTARLGDEYKTFLEALRKQDSAGNLEEYCKTLRQGNRLEKMKEIGQSLSFCENIEQAAEQINELSALSTDNRHIRHMSITDALNALFDRIENAERRKFIPWGIDILDDMLYCEAGDLIVLGGYPSAGKTAMSLQMALHQAQTKRVGYFSLETSNIKLIERMTATAAGISLKALKTRDLTESDHRAMFHAADSMSKLQIELFETSGATVQEIFNTALAKRLQIIYIDYLQLIKTGGKGGNRYEEVTKISTEIHTLAQRHKITVIALAQLSRPERKDGKKVAPTMQSFKESGQIEQDADVGLLLYLENDNDFKSPRILKIAKNKEGTRGAAKMLFDGEHQHFTEILPDRRDTQKKPSRYPKRDDGNYQQELAF